MKELIYLYIIACVVIFVSVLLAMIVANWIDRKMKERQERAK